MFTPKIVVLAALALVEIAAGVAALAQVQLDAAGESRPAVGVGSIWGNASLRCWCIIGSVMGGLLAVWILPEQGETVRRFAGKGACSMILGFLVSPLVIRWCNLPMDEDFVVGVSGIVAASGVTAIHLAAPVCADGWQRWVASRVRKIIPDNEEKRP